MRTSIRAIGNFERGIEERSNFGVPFRSNALPESIRLEVIRDIQSKTLTLLIVLNLVILVVSGSISYFLSGLTLKPIEKMVEKQKKFIADAAHELKTPLTSIKTQLEVGQKSNKFKGTESSTIVSSVIEDIDSLTSLTNGLLKASRYQMYESKSNLEKLNINELVIKTIESMSQKAKEKGIKISTKFEKGDLSLIGDKSAIRELLIILIDNSIKFNKSKGTIEISLTAESNNIFLTVKDSGIGIAKEDLPFVFDRFYKADNSRTRLNTEGFGLGLSIAKEIVTLHNGTISVQSVLSEGSTFLVTLPTSQDFHRNYQ
jgi:signal transduction histidine kinase